MAAIITMTYKDRFIAMTSHHGAVWYSTRPAQSIFTSHFADKPIPIVDNEIKNFVQP